MNHDDDLGRYVAEMEASDPGFRAERERLRPQFEFRKALIGARLALGLTQKQLAEKMGTSQAAVARLENGRSWPTLSTLQKLARVLDIDFTITALEPLQARARHPHKAA
ncbi:MAG: helix-turn-helix transcriptional regulator [Chloroflexi bacterium]|nr:helix-turn-helix transcriptional regulator [Chloroflexota bacterium]